MELCAIFHEIACSLPPDPNNKTLIFIRRLTVAQ